MRSKCKSARLITVLISTLLVALTAPSFALAQEPISKTETDAKDGGPTVESSLAIAYVSSNGNDAAADGTKDKPFATLGGAIAATKDGGSVVLLSDINASELIYVSGKNITINGDGHTVTRAEEFTPANDLGRGGYNPAMIEVANQATLKLENITLDDAFRTEGTEYELASTSEKGNEDKVQDGIIASYGDGHSTIILGNGCTLKNFGGNSAIYITGNAGDGAKLVMESGSQILDDRGSARKGGYAALFNHGGTAQIENGASIHDIDGRAIYSDNAGVTSLDGSVYNVTSNEVMKKFNGASANGFGGVFYFAEGKSTLTVGPNGEINDISSHDGNRNDVVIHLVGAKFSMQAGSRIHDIETMGIVDLNGGSVELGGEMYAIEGTNVFFRMRDVASTFILSESGSIHDCKTTDAGIVYLNGGKPTIKIAGTISNVGGTVFFISNNGSRQDGIVELTETGVIENATGTAILAGDPSDVKINGRISNCSGAAVHFATKGGSTLTIGENAAIEGNNGGKAQITVVGETAANNSEQHASIAAGSLKSGRSISIAPFGTVTLDSGYADIKLGSGSEEAVDVILSKMERMHADWTPVMESALWFNPSKNDIHFAIDPKGNPKKTGLFAVYIPLNDDGTARDGAEVVVEEVKNGRTVDATLKDLETGTSYALMLFNNNEYSFAPDDVTMYTGGGHGDEKYTDGMPSVTIEDSVDLKGGDIESLEIKGKPVTDDNGETLLSQLMDNLDVVYLDSDGNEVEDDNVPGEYTSKLVWKNGLTDDDVRVNGNDVSLDDEGTLIVRHTSDKKHAKDGTITYPLLASEPTSPVEHAEAIAKKGFLGLNPSFYLNDQREIDDTEGIQILDDTLLANFNDGRQELLESKAVEYLGAPGEGQAYRFDFHYLDLVDAYNGNVWVSAQYGTTVYLPYPEGVTAETAESLGLKVVHYMDLHREYGIAGHAEVSDAIAACTLEAMNVEYTPNGIKFDVPRSGFSPFAVVWQTQAHSITATCGKGGTISPEGTITVADGADKTFAVSPDSGYSIDKILVDGKTLSDSSLTIEDGITYYTFEDVTSDHTIEATFKSDSVVDPGGDSSSSGDNGNKTDSTDKIPETGDTNSPMLAALLGASALSIFVASVKRSKE